MPGIFESLATVNSLLRTLLAMAAVGLVSVGGWFGYQYWNQNDMELRDKERQLTAAQQLLTEKEQLISRKEQEIQSLNLELEAKDRQIQKLDTSLRLLKVDHRLARLTVLEQDMDPDSGELYSLVEFVEVSDDGVAIDDPKRMRVRGDLVYIDSWVVKFEDQYIEQSDLDRSTSLVLFRRIFGEQQNPKDGFVLDAVGVRPKVYGRPDGMSEFEQKIWGDFWNIANDEQRARELGIRAAQGEAPSIQVRKGKSYRVQLRASDGLSITPEDATQPNKPAT